jgi:thiamine biosynthesis lipoprotein
MADDAGAHAAIDAAFAEIALVHALMSFHEAESDLGLIHLEGLLRPVPVHPWTLDVLRFALALSADSHGAFDVTCAAEAVRAGALPRPASPFEPDTTASYRDIEVDEGLSAVRLHRPLWIDLGGVAKGYAVDRAVARLKAQGAEQGCVDAGGDLRVFGPAPERIALRAPLRPGAPMPIVEIVDGAIASSEAGADLAVHLDGRSCLPAPAGRFVSVIADSCMAADALTKVVMAKGEAAAPALSAYGAQALIFDVGQAASAIGLAA